MPLLATSSCPEVTCEKGFHKILQISHGNTCARVFEIGSSTDASRKYCKINSTFLKEHYFFCQPSNLLYMVYNQPPCFTTVP